MELLQRIPLRALKAVATALIMTAAPIVSAEVLLVDGSNTRGWTFAANPDVTEDGEAPVLGIADHQNGSASLNFSTTAGNSSSRSVTLLQSDFPESIRDVETLNHLTSMSWYVNHSASGKYPKIAIWAEWESDSDGTLLREALYFVPESVNTTAGQWKRMPVILDTSKFRNNGATTGGKKETRTFSQWLETVGEYRIYSVQISYNSPGIEYKSYVDFVEIN